MARCESCGGDLSGALVSAEELGRLINPDEPLSAAAVRQRCRRAGIRSRHGYPIEQVRGLITTTRMGEQE